MSRDATSSGGTGAEPRFFSLAQSRAREIIRNPEQLRRLIDEALRIDTDGRGPLAVLMEDIKTLIRMVIAYSNGAYRDVATEQIVLVVACLLYVASPVDLVPDALPGGLVDDAGVVIWVFNSVREELELFRAWESSQSTESAE